MKLKRLNDDHPANSSNRIRKLRQDLRTLAAGRVAVGNMAPIRTP